MSEQKTMSFELNQKQLDAAIAAAMPGLISNLEINYTSGRAPKGVTADVTLSQDLIREAVIVHTKKLVNASFSHFSVSFRATRGEDGLITTITASSDPIAEQEEDETSTPVATSTSATEDAAQAAREASEAAHAAAYASSVTEATPEASEAPFEQAAEATTEELAAVAPVEEVVATADATTTEANTAVAEAGTTEEAPKAAGRSRLFGDLSRPSN